MKTPQLSDEEHDRARDNLRTIMAARGWTQAEAAAAIGATQQLVSMFLNGQCRIGVRKAHAIAKLFGGAAAEPFTVPHVEQKKLTDAPLAIITTALMIDRLQGRDAALAFFASYLDRERTA